MRIVHAGPLVVEGACVRQSSLALFLRVVFEWSAAEAEKRKTVLLSGAVELIARRRQLLYALRFHSPLIDRPPPPPTSPACRIVSLVQAVVFIQVFGRFGRGWFELLLHWKVMELLCYDLH